MLAALLIPLLAAAAEPPVERVLTSLPDPVVPSPAEPPVEPVPLRTAVMVNPGGPLVAGVASLLGVPTFDANLRLHHVRTDVVGLTLQLDVTSTVPLGLRLTHASLRGGPRVALRKRGLADWTVTPFLSVGTTSASANGATLARYALVGLGVDAGRTWVWRHLAVELGVGAYSTIPMGFTTDAETLADQHPLVLWPVKPSLTGSVGYAF